MSKIMVMKIDPDGIPRAWGIAPTQEQAQREADRQLDVYRAAKREVGDPLAWAEYTDQVETVGG